MAPTRLPPFLDVEEPSRIHGELLIAVAAVRAGLTRRQAAMTTMAVLLVLDVSRSINARVGYASPIGEHVEHTAA